MWALYLAGFVAVALVLAAGYVWVQARRVDREHREMAEELVRAARREGGEDFAGADSESLPEPVRRYLGVVIPEGRARVRSIRFTQAGVFRTREKPERWRPFHAVQHVTTSPPGFVWDATVQMAPLLAVRVVDAYRAGAGLLRARLLGAFSVAEASGPEADSGEMMRYLSEAVWYPTALLPEGRLRWQAVDEHAAVAVLSDRGREVAMTFHFDESGLVAYCEGERFRIENGHSRRIPWRAYCGGYALRDGFRIPTEARVAWVLPSGEMEYFRGRIESIAYEP